jgi:hypothetical protein
MSNYNILEVLHIRRMSAGCLGCDTMLFGRYVLVFLCEFMKYDLNL